jgi:hypothetical protein
LDASNLNGGVSPQNTADYVVVEVFIGRESQHSDSSLRGSPRKQSVADSKRRKARFIFLTHLRRLLPAPLQVGIHLILMAEIIADDRVHLVQRDGRILFGNSFRRSPLVKGGYQRIESYARTADSHNTVRIGGERQGFRSDSERHQFTS